MTTTRTIPCGEDCFHASPDGWFWWRKCKSNDPCVSCLISAYKTYTAESDQTLADAEWLESIGVQVPSNDSINGLYGWRSKNGLNLCFQDRDFERVLLLHSPTRGAVLKIVAGIGGEG